MPIVKLNRHLIFPPIEWAEEDGLLAIGGDLSPERLMLAYQSGIFPWYNRKPILWWSPDPRFVIYPSSLKISKSMQKILARNQFHITVNQDFASVIKLCATQPREGQNGTWITQEMQDAYIQLHKLGFAHSVEAWQEGKLVGGLYGIKMKRCFSGESMFSHVSNASKAAFITYVLQLKTEGIELIDCQTHTAHLESLGGVFMERKQFVKFLINNE